MQRHEDLHREAMPELNNLLRVSRGRVVGKHCDCAGGVILGQGPVRVGPLVDRERVVIRADRCHRPLFAADSEGTRARVDRIIEPIDQVELRRERLEQTSLVVGRERPTSLEGRL